MLSFDQAAGVEGSALRVGVPVGAASVARVVRWSGRLTVAVRAGCGAGMVGVVIEGWFWS
ncbi:hypothetical protein GCM10009827_099070 [Dactylosporangium maewongense]|uniref:Uncharacterized protein n=1 Tax=Dactylosporangium maewongense TaxID=634393 RepID=A0ABN2CNY7_9ACTN